MRRRFSLGVAWVCSSLWMCSTLFASFHIVSDSVEFDSTHHTTSFTARFNHAPDFLTTDELGRQKNSFQYFFDCDTTDDSLSPAPGVTIIRGEEIHSADALRIRDSLGDDPAASSGGWGTVRSSVPFALDGDTVRFTVSWDALGQTGDHFRYALESYEFGSLNDARTRLIPLPQAFWAGGAMLAIIVVVQQIFSRHRPT